VIIHLPRCQQMGEKRPPSPAAEGLTRRRAGSRRSRDGHSELASVASRSAVRTTPWLLAVVSVLFAASFVINLARGHTGLAMLWAAALVLELVALASSIRRLRRNR
jgi:hypothetical protein